MQTSKRHKRSISFPNDLSDKTVEEFFDLLSTHTNPDSKVISVDCSQLDEVTSAHIGILWSARERCERDSNEMHLLFPTPGLIRILQVLDMEDLFKIVEDSETIDSGNIKLMETEIIHQKHNDAFNTNINDLNAALERFTSFLSKINLPGTMRFDLKTAFYEVVYNIYAHGTLTCDDEISFVADVYNNRIVMEFSDRGLAFDPTFQTMSYNPKDAIDDRRTRGFGLMMIKKLTDSISYVYRDNCMNVLILEKMWRRE